MVLNMMFPISNYINAIIVGIFAFGGLAIGMDIQGTMIGAFIGLVIALFANLVKWDYTIGS